MSMAVRYSSRWLLAATFGLACGHLLRRCAQAQPLALGPGPQVVLGELHGGDGLQLLLGHHPLDLRHDGVRLRTTSQCPPRIACQSDSKAVTCWGDTASSDSSR